MHVDSELCQGHTLCTLAASQVFRLGEDDGHAYVEAEEVPAELEEAVRRAAATCPEGAISISG